MYTPDPVTRGRALSSDYLHDRKQVVLHTATLNEEGRWYPESTVSPNPVGVTVVTSWQMIFPQRPGRQNCDQQSCMSQWSPASRTHASTSW